MTAVRVHISTFEYKNARFGWYELFADQTDLGSSGVEAYAAHSAIFFADYYLHPNLNGGETWHYWVRAVFDNGDTVGNLTYLGAITLAGGDTDSDGSSGVGEYASIPFVFDGGGAAIATGYKGHVRIDFDCTIVEWALAGIGSGSIVVDTWKCTQAQWDGGSTHPVAGDTIWSGSKPTISGATNANATGLSITVNAGDWLGFNVDSVATFQQLTLGLKVLKT